MRGSGQLGEFNPATEQRKECSAGQERNPSFIGKSSSSSSRAGMLQCSSRIGRWIRRNDQWAAKTAATASRQCGTLVSIQGSKATGTQMTSGKKVKYLRTVRARLDCSLAGSPVKATVFTVRKKASVRR